MTHTQYCHVTLTCDREKLLKNFNEDITQVYVPGIWYTDLTSLGNQSNVCILYVFYILFKCF